MRQAWLGVLVVAALAALVQTTGINTVAPPKGDQVGQEVVQPNNPVCPLGCKGEPGLTGQTGRQGRPGPRGSPGMPGVAGYKGWSEWAGWKDNYRVQAVKGGRGDQGPSGPPGNPGADGRHGVQGSVGDTGALGPPGMPGERGIPGAPGAPGQPGPAGRQGPRGADGPNGEVGPRGDVGPPGDRGARGAEGNTGVQGTPGSPGANGGRGPKGIPGDQGARGAPGEKGFKGSNGEVGAVGDPGQFGDTGNQGLPGQKGLKGYPGTSGAFGSKGEHGAKGERGPYIEKIGLNETSSCTGSTGGKVKYDPYLKKLYFCNGNRWMCVKSRVCDEPCRVSDWGPWAACSATCGDAGVTTRSRVILSGAAVEGAPCPELLDIRQCTGVSPCNCADPGQVEHAQRFGNDFSIGASVRWQCQTGYQINGATASICLSDSTTNTAGFSSKPTCVAVQCPGLEAPINGNIAVPSPAIYQSQAVFTCNPGYQLAGSSTLSCQASGTWDAQPPTCRPIRCDDPGTPENGGRNATSLTFNSVISYYCNPGYELRGSSTITCQVGGFTDSAPTCVAITCANRQPPANGRVVGTGNTYASTAQYTCNSGYRLIGEAIAVCQIDGTWSDNVPQCQLIQCPQLEQGENYEPIVISNFVVGGTATHRCQRGYLLSGSATRTCMANGQWSGQPPTCTSVTCPDPGRPENGDHMSFENAESFPFGHVVSYQCRAGYVLTGSSSATCTETGVWSSPTPTCRPITCPLLSAPQNGQLFMPTTTFGSRAVASCNVGYTLSGSKIRLCEASRSWSGSAPTCTVIDCGVPPVPSNGAIVETMVVGNRGPNTYQSSVTYGCNVGYKMVGEPKSICEKCGDWTGTTPICQPISCEIPGVPSNGGRTGANLTLNAQVQFRCNQGFSLIGERNLQCMSSGNWSQPIPSCEIAVCEDLVAPANGVVRSLGREFMSQATYICNAGYRLVGDSMRMCSENSEWSGSQPTCRMIDCGALPAVSFAVQTGDTTTFGATVNYACQNGYRLQGASSRTCQANGFWSSSPPTCVLIPCGNPGRIVNGVRTGNTFTFGATVNYVCNDGYVLIGSASRVCGSDGLWDGSAPSCQPMVCDDPGFAMNGARELSSLRVGSQSKYTCDLGFVMSSGTPTRTCLVSSPGSASWNGSLPVCTVVDCRDPGVPENGVIVGTSFTYTSEVQFLCGKAYEVEGSSRRVCRADGTWSGEPASCSEIICPNPSPPPNGAMSAEVGGTTSFTEKITFTCNTGYLLTGKQELDCQENREFSGSVPTCIVRTCGNPGKPTFGQRVGDSFDFGSTVVYSCDAGYTLQGSPARNCLASGMWSGNDPRCVSVTCPDPGSPQNGDRDIRSLNAMATVNYTCNPGYQVAGTTTRTCSLSSDRSMATWTNSLPRCTIVNCGDIPTPEHGSKIGLVYTFGAQVDFDCDEGYKLSNSRSRICQANGQWSGTQPVCTLVSCDALTDPSGGSVTVSSTTYGSVARYQCSAGYNLAGARTRECQANSEWSSATPSCNLINCGNPGFLASGSRQGDTFTFGSSVRYACNAGYVLVGMAVSTCQSSGTWNNPVPFCRLLDCQDPGLPENGDRSMLFTSVGAVVNYTCVRGYTMRGANRRVCQANPDNTAATWSNTLPTCEIVNCGPLPPPDNGRVRGRVFTYTGSLFFECNNGYNLVGSQVRFCLANGQWSGVESQCRLVNCGAPDTINSGDVEFTSTSFDSVAVYSCQSGYALQGTTQRRCQMNGLWSGAAPRCIVIGCGDPGTPSHSTRDGENFIFNSIITYTCNPGYRMVGTQRLTCQTNGRWTNSPPTCVLLSCDDPQTPRNGDRSLGRTTVGSTVNYTCNTGYTLTGVSTRTCLVNQDGTSASWNSTLPVCNIVSCNDPGVIENGVRTGNVFVFGGEVTYSCNTGYTLTGTRIRRCQANGQWSGTPAACQIVDCGSLNPPSNGAVEVSTSTFGSTARYSCNSGYARIGAATRQCQVNSEWSGGPPFCIVISCGNPGAPANGNRAGETFIYQSAVTYTCNRGYRLVGAQSATCLASSFWSNPVPRCVLLSCGDPGRPANGDRDFRFTNVGADVNYTCNIGYSMVGERRRTCNVVQDGADWSGTMPSCQIVNCGDPGPLANGAITGSVFTYQSHVSFTCQVGYMLQGSNHRTCQASGQWSGSTTSCALIDCGDPGRPDNGGRTGDSTVYNSVMQFTCIVGYSLHGSQSRRCQANGLWSGSQPTCQIVDCGDPGTPDNGVKTGSQTVYQSRVSFTCNSGYTLTGEATRTCLANGQWSGVQPTCQAIVCSDPGIPVNGGRDGSSLTVGSVVTYFCGPGFTLVGDNQRTCQANQQFDGTLPSCSPISCGNPGIPADGNRDGDDFFFTNQVSYTCNVGYRLSGSQIRVCLATGEWSGNPASCALIDCGDPGTPENGGRTLTGSAYGSSVSYRCNAGYHLVGADRRQCQANGYWSLSLPECRLVQCCDLTAPTNGEMIGSLTNFNATMNFRCNPGYSIIGSERRRCMGNGSWTGVPPSCEPVTCLDPGTISNGVRTEISLAVGGQSVFQCNVGYRMVGSPRLTCQADGTWDLPLPTCVLITCQDPGIPDNGERTGNNFSYTAEVTYRCNENYVRNGPRALRCIIADNGTGVWNVSRPTCDPNCVVSEYSEFGPCSVTCNNGFQRRNRNVLQQPSGAGAACPDLEDSKLCNLRPCVLCESRFREGEIVFRIRQQDISPATDVVIVVDESLSMEGEHQWLPGMIQNLDSRLQAQNIGSDPRRRNLFALVGFGLRRVVNGIPESYPHHYSTASGKPIFGAHEFPEVAAKLVADGDVEDGYLAMSYGINNITWPNGTQALRKNVIGIAQNLIFITDEDRDTLSGGAHLNRREMKKMLRRNNVVPNVVVDQRFYHQNDQTAIGIDYQGNAYIPTTGGGYRNTTDGVRIGKGYRQTRRHYTGLALDKQVHGAAWDINILRDVTGTVSASFTEAFINVKTSEIIRQVNLCLECKCEDDGATGRFQCQRAGNQETCCSNAGATFVDGICEI